MVYYLGPAIHLTLLITSNTILRYLLILFVTIEHNVTLSSTIESYQIRLTVLNSVKTYWIVLDSV